MNEIRLVCDAVCHVDIALHLEGVSAVVNDNECCHVTKDQHVGQLMMHKRSSFQRDRRDMLEFVLHLQGPVYPVAQ